MRILIRHQTFYRYSAPALMVQQVLRLTPRSHEGHHVVGWRIGSNADCRLKQGEDPFGNITHTFTASGAFDEIELYVEGHVETFDTHGVVRNAAERFPPILFLRESGLTKPGPAIRSFAHDMTQNQSGPLERMHALMDAIFRTMVFDADPTHPHTGAEEALTLGRGVCQDFAHIMIACARILGVPARYAGGHFLRSDGVEEQAAGHAWMEAHVPGLGWVAFDPANGVCAGERHVRVAAGPDYLAAAPVRGQITGGGGENLSVSVHVSQALDQRQN